ncbi:MAG: LysR family transcriptional regulator [Alphaproteobacteria bacterium]
MDIRQIRYALAVAREHSFTGAAQRLHISQSSVSEQVAALEDDIGFRIFHRTGRGVETTERGRSFLAEAERVAQEFLGLSDTARRLNGAGFETFTLGMGSGMAGLVVPNALSHFCDIFPNVQLRIVTAPTRRIYDQLHTDQLDAGVAIELPTDELPTGLMSLPIAKIQMVLIGHAAHPLLAEDGPIDLGHLIEEPLITNELTIGYGRIVTTMFADIGAHPNIRAVADNIDTLREMVAAGMGVAIIPRSALLQSGNSPTLGVRAITPDRQIGFCIVRRRQAMSRSRESYFAFLSDALANAEQ